MLGGTPVLPAAFLFLQRAFRAYRSMPFSTPVEFIDAPGYKQDGTHAVMNLQHILSVPQDTTFGVRSASCVFSDGAPLRPLR